MEKKFRELLEIHTPKTNRDVCEGLACTYIPMAESYIDSVLTSACNSFPSLEYIGPAQRCTPEEEFAEVTKPRNNRRTFNLAESSIYLLRYQFRYKGRDLPPKFINLPYVKPGGIMMLSGSTYHISPVLTDKVISPSTDTVFVRLLRDKIIFQRCYHTMIIDRVKETSHVIWAKIYRKSNDKKSPPTTKANSCIVHYLLCLHGLSDMFQKYLGFTPVVGGDEITAEKYPPDEWVICQSTQTKPKTCIGDFYVGSTIKVAVPRQYWDDHTKSYVLGFFYVVDHFPMRVQPEHVNNKMLWMVLLGHIIFSGVYSEGRLIEQTSEHFDSLDEYMDVIITSKLKEIGYDINDFYTLLAVIIRDFNTWIIASAKNSTSLYGKSLEILYFALFDITSAIFRTIYRLTKQSKKKELTEKDVIDTLQKYLKSRGIFGLTRSNIAMSNVSYSGDNMYLKITSVLAQQKSTTGAKRGKKTRTTVNETKRIHSSMVEGGSVLFLPKKTPTPAARINPFVHVDLTTGTIIPNPQFTELLEKTEEQLKGTI